MNKPQNAKKRNAIISIITVNYNSDGGLVSTVDSIIQFIDLLKVELILVDGLSSDDSLIRLGSKKELFSVIISEKDKGIYDAMNKGIKYAKGDWIWFLNSGDVALESSGKILPYLNSEKEYFNFLYCNFSTNSGVVVAQTFSITTLFKGMINHQTIFYRRDLIDCFDLSFGLGADFAHLMKHYSEIRHKKIDIALVRYDLNGKSSILNRFIRVKTWYQRFRAFKNSSLRMDFKLFGMTISLMVCVIKFIAPRLGSRTHRLK